MGVQLGGLVPSVELRWLRFGEEFEWLASEVEWDDPAHRGELEGPWLGAELLALAPGGIKQQCTKFCVSRCNEVNSFCGNTAQRKATGEKGPVTEL